MKSTITIIFEHDKILDVNHLVSDVRWVVQRFKRDNKIDYNLIITRDSKEELETGKL